MATRNDLTYSIEDYLKTIYVITTTNERASTNQISEALGVTPASVSGMIKKLAETDPPLVEYYPHRGVTLTQDGEQVALEMLRHHRLLELFLHQVLGYEWDQVHAEAERLEHVISEEFEERIAHALGNPSHDPHGDPIPDRELVMPESSDHKLVELQVGQKAEINRVGNKDPEFLRHLSKMGLIPGEQIQVMDYSPYDKNMTLLFRSTQQTSVIGPAITNQIFVEVVP